jgi:hypothetical protein
MNLATISACICYNEDFFAKNKFIDQNGKMRNVSGFLISQIPPENLRDGGDRAQDAPALKICALPERKIDGPKAGRETRVIYIYVPCQVFPGI